MEHRRPELLAPAGDMTMLVAALNAGADAVYLGVKDLNMRATAGNFELSQLDKAVQKCRTASAHAYLTLNSIVYEDELEKVSRIISRALDAGMDAVIAWDMAVIAECIRKGMPVHLSTQASVANFEALRQYARLGIRRVVLARECSLAQLADIRRRMDAEGLGVELEAFVHGAMCVSISGRCLISQFVYGRSANRGDCVQPCRRDYEVIDRATGFRLALENHYVLSPSDLCTITFVDRLIEAGLDSFKIEGRSKRPEYVHNVVRAYREAIDAYREGRYTPEIAGMLEGRLRGTFNRGFSAGFYMGAPVDSFTNAYGPKGNVAKQYVGRVKNCYRRIGVIEVGVEGEGFGLGDALMVQGPATGVVEGTVTSIRFDGRDMKRAEKGMSVGVLFPGKTRRNDRVFLTGQAPSPANRPDHAPPNRTG